MTTEKQQALQHLKNDLNFLKSKGFDERKLLIKENVINQIEEFLNEITISDLLEEYLNENEHYPGAIPVNDYYMMFPIWMKRETIGDFKKRAINSYNKNK